MLGHRKTPLLTWCQPGVAERMTAAGCLLYQRSVNPRARTDALTGVVKPFFLSFARRAVCNTRSSRTLSNPLLKHAVRHPRLPYSCPPPPPPPLTRSCTVLSPVPPRPRLLRQCMCRVLPCWKQRNQARGGRVLSWQRGQGRLRRTLPQLSNGTAVKLCRVPGYI